MVGGFLFVRGFVGFLGFLGGKTQDLVLLLFYVGVEFAKLF
jgi:hypothetical protein